MERRSTSAEHAAVGALDSASIDEFLKSACLSYGDDDWPSKWRRAERLLAQHPELARANLYTAAVSGEVAHLRSLLTATPGLASQPGGPQRWAPLMFVCYGRVTNPAAVEIASALLDAGADSNVRFETGDGNYQFTALTGAIGHGELGQPEHPQAEQLARLLLTRGARPDDAQALYNTHLDGDDPRWLEVLFEHGLDRNAVVNWQTRGKEPPKILDYLLPQAAAHGHVKRVRCLLEHGANPDARSTYNDRSSYQAAWIAGETEIAALLVDHGATAEPVRGRDAFIAACARNDGVEARALLAGHRDYLDSAQPLIDAAAAGNVPTVSLLLELGMNPNGAGIHGHRALHVGCKHRAVTDVLFAHGADPRSRCFAGSVTGWARHSGQIDDARYYAEQSRSLLDAAMSGHVALARELLRADPGCVNERSPSGNGPLHELTDDYDRALELIALLLAHRADPQALNHAAETPVKRLEALGLDSIAAALEAAS